MNPAVAKTQKKMIHSVAFSGENDGFNSWQVPIQKLQFLNSIELRGRQAACTWLYFFPALRSCSPTVGKDEVAYLGQRFALLWAAIV